RVQGLALLEQRSRWKPRGRAGGYRSRASNSADNAVPPPRSGGGWPAAAKRRRVGWGLFPRTRSMRPEPHPARCARHPPLALEGQAMTARDLILSSIRRSLGVTGAEAPRRKAVEDRLTQHPAGIVPARGNLPPAERLALFRTMVAAAAGTIE